MCQYKGAVQLENTVVQILPNDYEAERSCIGCILLSSDCAGAVFERVKSKEYFYRPNHQELYESIKALYNSGRAIDTVTLMSELMRRGTLEVIGPAWQICLTILISWWKNISFAALSQARGK